MYKYIFFLYEVCLISYNWCIKCNLVKKIKKRLYKYFRIVENIVFDIMYIKFWFLINGIFRFEFLIGVVIGELYVFVL